MSLLWQELDKLMVFVVVADKGKINKASEVLNLTQPSITRSIQKLEQAFGVELFTRSRDGVTLTKGGSLLYEQASRFLRDLEDIRVRSASTDQDFSGLLTVGTYESLAEYLWPDFLIKLQRIHPELLLSVRTGNFDDSFQDLPLRKIDILVDAEPRIRSGVVAWPLYSDKFACYISSDYQKAKFDQNWALGAQVIYVRQAYDEQRLTIENHFENEGYRFSREYCFDSFSTVKRLAIKGMGLAVLPKRLAEEDEKLGKLKNVALKGFPSGGFGKHTIYATIDSKNEKDLRLRRIISLLREHFR